MKHISSYLAPVGEKRAKPTDTDENQNEAITTNYKIQIQTPLLTQTHRQDMAISQLHKMY